MAGEEKIPFFRSIQFKYTLSYLAAIAVVLVLMNTYPVLVSQNLVFRSKQAALQSQMSVITSALDEQEVPSAERTEQVMKVLGDMSLGRILVTSTSGQILYDSTGGTDADGYGYALLQPVERALKGNDVFLSSYTGGSFVSEAASPLVYRNMVVGCVYLCDVDTEQAQLLQNVQITLRTASLAVCALVAGVSVAFSRLMKRRTDTLLGAIRSVREGEYGTRTKVRGGDELSKLSEEFNSLTDRLQETETVRRRFVSDASHELRTPLASIRLLTDSILQSDGMDEETMRDFVGDIGDEAGRLQRITEKLLTMTRLDNRAERETERVDVGDVLRKAERLLRPLAQKAEVSVLLEERQACAIRCTEDDLYQIVFNLMENGVKYNRPGGWVKAILRREEDQAVLDVEDNGVGIPEEDIDKVFLRFYRVDKARSRACGGTGLGLSIVRDMAESYGGAVTARRREPEGSIFTVRFPLDRGEAAE